MLLYLILLPILYLIVAYISIFKMRSIFTRILRIIMGVLLLFVVAITTLQFPKENWWVFIVLLLLVVILKSLALKLKDDEKGVNILNIISIILIVIYVILALFLY